VTARRPVQQSAAWPARSLGRDRSEAIRDDHGRRNEV